MKLSEIAVVGPQYVSGIQNNLLGDWEAFSTRFNTTSESFIVERCRIADTVVIRVLSPKSRKHVAWMVMRLSGKIPTISRPCYMVQRTWTEPAYRRRGIMLELYVFVHDNLGVSLLSDVKQTAETVNLWKKLASKKQVQMFDRRTRKLGPVTDELYKGNNNILLLVYE